MYNGFITIDLQSLAVEGGRYRSRRRHGLEFLHKKFSTFYFANTLLCCFFWNCRIVTQSGLIFGCLVFCAAKSGAVSAAETASLRVRRRGSHESHHQNFAGAPRLTSKLFSTEMILEIKSRVIKLMSRLIIVYMSFFKRPWDEAN